MAIPSITRVDAILLLGLAFFSSSVVHGIGETVFDVTKHGAKPDGTTDNVEAFMQVWLAACSSTAPAKVVVPAGTFFMGPAVFQGPCKVPIIFEVQGVVKGVVRATTDITEYTSEEWILFETIDGLTLNGKGTLAKVMLSGNTLIASRTKNVCGSPAVLNVVSFTSLQSIKLRKVNNGVVHDISSLNSKNFHFHVTDCTNLTLHSLNITALGNSPNTDGIHISTSKLVNVTRSVIGTGDDCISIGHGAFNITISQIFCGPGHGISVGSLGKYKVEQDVMGILVSNCTLSNTTYGARIKSYAQSDPSQASNIIYQDIIMDSVHNPIIIDQTYGSGEKSKQTQEPSQSQVKISDVHFKNIKGTSASDVAVTFLCSAKDPCEGVELLDIDLAFNGAARSKTLSSSCVNAKFTTGGKQNPPPCPP
ncbi:hypothetical protein Tsubulata_012361 [Turnera subulata]|uniref:Uncharacterized protein n=1 Tax=Turnera subulata TaxID=218843 RepID=A0A9Q0F3P3_9ROSI|nr:hypothetical protein Tsubulata_012361 [Turnera subulata]